MLCPSLFLSRHSLSPRRNPIRQISRNSHFNSFSRNCMSNSFVDHRPRVSFHFHFTQSKLYTQIKSLEARHHLRRKN
ncbi:hypothetical protein V6Z12_A01G141300 [Gossypium hirsutum]